MRTIKTEGFYIVLCEKLRAEYLNHLYGRSAGKNYWLLKQKLQDLKEEIEIYYPTNIPEKRYLIKDDDQHVLDCALNTDYVVHLLLTDNQKHFKPDNEDFRLPIIITSEIFFNPSELHTCCSEGKRVESEIIRKGERYRTL
jgi:hypothetical protein